MSIYCLVFFMYFLQVIMILNDYLIPPYSNINLQIFAGNRKIYPQTWGGNGILDNFSRLYFLHDGGGTVILPGETVRLRPGRLFLIPELTRANYAADGPLELCWVHFRAEFFTGLSMFHFYAPPREIAAPPDAAALFDRLLDRLDDPSPRDMAAKYAALLQLLGGFLPAGQSPALLPPEAELREFEAVLSELSTHPEQPFDLRQLAAKVHLHPTYFSNRFKATFGLSPLQFQIKCRMTKAQQLLAASELSLAEIAEVCGYRDAFFFARTVKKYFGTPPGLLRRQLRRFS